jgi:hypothetical protein
MSLETAKAFAVLVDSLIGIAELTAKNKNITIEIKEGSACVALYGEPVSIIKKELDQIVSIQSVESSKVKYWNDMREIISANGYDFKAEFTLQGTVFPLMNILKSSKKLVVRRTKNPPVSTNIVFMTGKLIAVGGKSPNIHIDDETNKRQVLKCTHVSATKAKAFLYQDIVLSAWSEKKTNSIDYELCDSYYQKDIGIYNEFKDFIKKFTNAEDDIASYKLLHYQCRRYLDEQDYGTYRKFLRLFVHEKMDINILNTILIISDSLRSNDRLKELLDRMEEIFDSKNKKYKIKINAVNQKGKEVPDNPSKFKIE